MNTTSSVDAHKSVMIDYQTYGQIRHLFLEELWPGAWAGTRGLRS